MVYISVVPEEEDSKILFKKKSENTINCRRFIGFFFG